MTNKQSTTSIEVSPVELTMIKWYRSSIAQCPNAQPVTPTESKFISFLRDSNYCEVYMDLKQVLESQLAVNDDVIEGEIPSPILRLYQLVDHLRPIVATIDEEVALGQ